MTTEIYAGIPYKDFKDLIEQSGKIIDVYSKDDPDNPISNLLKYKDIDSLILCYIYDFKGFKRAYFSKTMNVWGDDWNDSPYEDNSGDPYDYEIRVEFITPLLSPAERSYGDCHYSVIQINNGETPWLSY